MKFRLRKKSKLKNAAYKNKNYLADQEKPMHTIYTSECVCVCVCVLFINLKLLNDNVGKYRYPCI